jgi:hypothetical protein
LKKRNAGGDQIAARKRKLCDLIYNHGVEVNKLAILYGLDNSGVLDGIAVFIEL